MIFAHCTSTMPSTTVLSFYFLKLFSSHAPDKKVRTNRKTDDPITICFSFGGIVENKILENGRFWYLFFINVFITCSQWQNSFHWRLFATYKLFILNFLIQVKIFQRINESTNLYSDRMSSTLSANHTFLGVISPPENTTDM